MSTTTTTTEEIELKVRLPSRAALDRLLSTLLNNAAPTPPDHPSNNTTHTTPRKPLKRLLQTDTFLDTPSRTLWNTSLSVFRIRQIQQIHLETGDLLSAGESKYKITIKTGSVVEDGVMSATEEESTIEESLACRILKNPSDVGLWRGGDPLLETLVARYGLEKEGGLMVLGGYVTERTCVEFHGAEVVELDETTYTFGRAWELEIETKDPASAEARIKHIMDSINIPFIKSQRNKFDTLMAGSLP
ncbi:hypothetical protein HDV05_001940 [Chytridiales sp. JEL 0842]|nr:hypothetical protein HDV05_001940 [Chytridiales sp. JEL 0842]